MYRADSLALTNGTRLGPYEVVAPIGSGGMGEVYRARDTRLDREVAVKILPPQFAADPEFRARFDREARAVSSLDHPHICAVYDVGEAPAISPELPGPVRFLVMPLLEGETLADRLAPLDVVTQGIALPLRSWLTIIVTATTASSIGVYLETRQLWTRCMLRSAAWPSWLSRA